MNSSDSRNQFNSPRGNALLVVLLFCLALLIVSAAFFRSMSTSRLVAHKSELLLQAREGAEAALGYASADLNRKATSLAALSDNPLSGFTLTTAELNNLASSGTKNNLLASSIEVKPGKLSASKTDMILNANDPAYAGDQSAGLKLAVRSGLIYAKATAKDAITGALTTSYISGIVQVREQTWLNYGMFYNMDMEFFPGKPMDVTGAIHTNADLFLSSDGSTASFYQKVTAAGHIYKGVKYNAKGYNADGSLTGFEKKSGTGGPFDSSTDGKGTGKPYITYDGTNLLEMTATWDCLGTKTNPTDNLATWTGHENTDWKKYVMDVSLNVEKFSPPGLPLYVPENFSTKTTTELRNHGYAMIEPQLPATDNRRYYGRKTSDVENLKFSALAGMTIVVEDLDLAADATAAGFYDATASAAVTASNNGKAIPWKLVWYDGATLATQPLSKENLPSRDGTTKLPIQHVIDPFARNDEVDFVTDNTITVTMRRNLKTLLRDAIVVVPYHDSGGGAASFGTGTTAVNISTYPAAVSFTPNVPAGTFNTRYNQPAGAYPALNTADATTYNPINYGKATAGYDATGATGTDRYPDSGKALAAGSRGELGLNQTLNIYSGIYDRRQGYNQTTATNDALKGAMHMVYINLQKLNWIINHSELWTHPTAPNPPIYKFDESYTNMIYVDLPSKAKDATRFALADSDKVCPAASPTATKPGYCVLLDKGARLPRLPYNESIRTPGFTIATNGPLYTRGNYNADGISTTGDSVVPDTGSTHTNWYSLDNPTANEMPAMVAADAVTFLTEAFLPKNSNKGLSTDATKPLVGANGNGTEKRYNGYDDDTTTTTSNFLEVSTALITGLTSTIPHYYTTGNTTATYTNPVFSYSGSVNNLPRFQESLGITVRYRGSMAALYESEVANAYFIQGKHGYWFAPPTRDWGYHSYLAAGMYPPGTPVIRSTRLIAIQDLTASQYTTGPAQPP